jgi:hypothetical protein
MMPISRVTTPILPSRYDEVLNQRVAQQAQALIAAGRASTPIRVPRWTVPLLIVVGGTVAVLALAATPYDSTSSRVPFEKRNVISAGSVGVQASAEELVGPSPAPRPSPSSESAAGILPSANSQVETKAVADRILYDRPSESRTARRAIREGDSHSTQPDPTPSPRCRSCRPGLATANATDHTAEEPLEEVGGQYAADVPAMVPAPECLLNVGTRFRATLTDAAVTSFAGTPVTATLQNDLISNGQVILPEGTTVVGEAFGTSADDRAQVALTAFVKDGVTVPFRGVVIGADSRLGVAGRVVHKGSMRRKGAGRFFGAVGSAVAAGLAAQAGGGVVGNAGVTLAGDLASDMNQLERTWASERSDKAVAIPARTVVTVYVQSDVRIRP